MGIYGERFRSIMPHRKLLSKSAAMAIIFFISVQFGEINSQSGPGDCTGGSTCLGGYCPGGSYGSRTCVDGYCRCPNNPSRDYCTCRPISGSCHVIAGAPEADRVGVPRFDNRLQTTQSCVANQNCNYDVHVISNYESDGSHGFGVTSTSGTTNVDVRVTGNGSKPLILVFVSYEPIRWILSVPQGVIIDRVLLGSYYLSDSSVSYTSWTVLNYERQPYSTLPYGRGDDSGGGNSVELLDYVVGRFGHVASFTSTYRANSWILNIERRHTQGCSGDTGSPSVTQPICGACSTLFSPLNGTVTFSSISLSVGTSATYRCNYGYSLSGSAYRTCLSSCSWSGTQPSCERQACSRLSNPSNGDVSFSSSTLSVGTTATYSCDSGYLLTGSSLRTCLSSGEWSGYAPYCKFSTTKACARLTAPSHGIVRFTSYSRSDGSRAIYTCDSRYYLVGTSTRICQSSGSWSGSPPYCQAFGSAGASSSGTTSTVVGATVGPITGLLFLVGCFIGCFVFKRKNRNPRRVPQTRPRIQTVNSTPCVVRTSVVMIRAQADNNHQNSTLPNTSSSAGIRLNTYTKSELQEKPPPDYSSVMDYKTASAQAPTSDPPAYDTLLTSGVIPKRPTPQL